MITQLIHVIAGAGPGVAAAVFVVVTRRNARRVSGRARAETAELIARAIEDSVREPLKHCAGDPCPDCARYGQSRRDAALARETRGAR